jgi:hypothetical protein
MSLNVVIINKHDGQTVGTTDGVQITIMIDDAVSAVANKIFCMTEGVDWYPNFSKINLKAKDGTLFEPDDYTKTLLAIGDVETSPLTIYVTNLLQVIDEIENVDYGRVFFDDELKSELHTKLKASFYLLEERDLDFVIAIKLLESDGEFYKDLVQQVQDYISTTLAKKSAMIDDFAKTEREMSSFNQVSREIQNYGDYLEMKDDMQRIRVNFTSVDLRIKQREQEGQSGTRWFVKLQQIFNTLQLTDKIPFVAYKPPKTPNPLVKVYNKILEDVREKELKSWVLNEKRKSGIVSYKKVRGLLIYYRLYDTQFLVVNIFANGNIHARVNLSDDTPRDNLDELTASIYTAVDEIINAINSLLGVLSHGKRLMPISQSEVSVAGISGKAVTTFLINRKVLMSVLNNEGLRKIFQLKDTLSEDVLSLFYKKRSETGVARDDAYDEEDESFGITVNIQDNPYLLNSSIITVYSAGSLTEIEHIIKQIVVVGQLKTKGQMLSPIRKQKIKEKSHIKELRKSGVTILSTKCQKPRQPIVPTESTQTTPVEGSYVLAYEGKNYICPRKEYPYPGFTNENIVCCFKKDQRRRDTYMRNVKSADLDIQVAPSNFKIRVIDSQTGRPFETFAIKVLSNYMDEFDEDSVTRYHYLTSNNELVPIDNKDLIQRLKSEEENNIWLDGVPLTKIINMPPKNKCNYPPDMNVKDIQDINAPCGHHTTNKFFGYNLNSYPCCFDKPRDVTMTRRKKVSDITKQHILISDKILEYQRLGILPSGLDILLNEVVDGADGAGGAPGDADRARFYRMGVVQNNNSFLNAVLMCLSNKIGEATINNSTEFKKYIVNYLNEPAHKSLFKKLNGGNISFKFVKLQNYIDTIMDADTVAYWNDYVDLIQRITKVNIMILEIPYVSSDSTKLPDYANTKVLCNPYITYDPASPYIILIKRMNTFEIVVHITRDGETPDIKYTYYINPGAPVTQNIANLLYDYYTTTCVREDEYPGNFPFVEMMELRGMVESLSETEHKVIAQITNRFNKVEYVLTKRGALVPVKETGIVNGIPSMTMSQYLTTDKIPNLAKYIIAVNGINAVLSSRATSVATTITLRGLSVPEGKINGVMTNFGQFVPLEEEVLSEKSNPIGLPVLDYYYYPDINENLFMNGHNPAKNDQYLYSLRSEELRKVIFKVKTVLGESLSNDDVSRMEIRRVVFSTVLPRYAKLSAIESIFRNFSDDITSIVPLDKKLEGFIYQHIANEVLNDNVEELLLNNMVVYDTYNPNEIVRREDETVLQSIDEFRRWSKQYGRND